MKQIEITYDMWMGGTDRTPRTPKGMNNTQNRIITQFLKHVAFRTGTTVENIMSRSRKREECCLPRQIAMYVIRMQSKLSLKKIAQFFDRDHSTVINSVNSFKGHEKNRKMQITILQLMDDYDRVKNSTFDLNIYQDAIFDDTDYEMDLTI